MARLTWQNLNAILLGILASGGVITLAILFSGLGTLAGVDVTYHSPDQVCQDCMAEIHINSTYWEICFEASEKDDVIFKKQSRSRRLWVNLNQITLTDPPIVTEVLVPTVKRFATETHEGQYLRPLKDGDCIKRYNKYNRNVNKIYIKGNPDGQLIKWGVPFLNVDPYWIGYKYIYQNETIQSTCTRKVNVTEHQKVPIYQNYTQEEPCKVVNVSCYTPCINKSMPTKNCYGEIKKKIIGYKNVNYTFEETQKYKCNQSVATKQRIGVEIDNKTYMDSYGVSVYDDKLYEWLVPAGDRNWEEYPYSQYEVDKGVVIVKNITVVDSKVVIK